MGLHYKNIVKSVSESNGINEDELNSINLFVFKQLSEWKRCPGEIPRCAIRRLGTFYFRRKKLLSNINSLSSDNKIIARSIINGLDSYKNLRVNHKIEKYGKEAYEAYKMAYKAKIISRNKEVKYREHL